MKTLPLFQGFGYLPTIFKGSQVNRVIVAAQTGLNVNEDRATIQGKEGSGLALQLIIII